MPAAAAILASMWTNPSLAGDSGSSRGSPSPSSGGGGGAMEIDPLSVSSAVVAVMMVSERFITEELGGVG